MHSVITSATILLLISTAAAVLIQDYTNALPLGLFNQGREQYSYLTRLFLIVIIGMLVVLTIELLKQKSWHLATLIRSGVAVFIITELLLRTGDHLFISHNSQNRFGGPYYERQNAQGQWVFLRKAHAGSAMGFRTDHPYKRAPDTRRILFLGDSYTEGSGHSFECNYPNVVERVLRDKHPGIEIMNSGVSGYGPVDALNLLRLLKADGYRFDALVYNLFTENDFTDNLPETERRVVAGMIFRFPRSWFLRAFHPLNTYVSRYALVLWRLRSLPAQNETSMSLSKGRCDYSEVRESYDSPVLRDLVQQRIAGNLRATQSKQAQQEFIDALKAIKTEADNSAIPLFIVVFPDRVLVDAELRKRLNVSAEELEQIRSLQALVRQALPSTSVIEVADVLRQHRGVYLNGDTHLSDLGNKIAGEYVGQQLDRIPLLSRR